MVVVRHCYPKNSISMGPIKEITHPVSVYVTDRSCHGVVDLVARSTSREDRFCGQIGSTRVQFLGSLVQWNWNADLDC